MKKSPLLKKYSVLAILLCLCASLFAQDKPSTLPDTLKISLAKDTLKPHSPKKATIMSAIVPGLGQAYNKKYWKIPIVYAGLGAGVYFTVKYRNEYVRYKTGYLALVDDDPNTVSEFEADFVPESSILSTMEQNRQFMEYALIGSMLFYALNVIDASVDAHLFYFDVSDDLSMNVEPLLYPSFNGTQVTQTSGLKLTFSF